MSDCSNCTTDLCVVRNRKLPASQLTTCRNGNSAAVDTLLAMIEQGRAERREARKETPFTKASNLKWAAPSPPSTVGTIICSALELSGLADNLTGRTRNYCSLLNFPQRHDAESITDQLTDLLQWESVQNVKRFRTVPVSREWVSGLVTQAIADGIEESIRSPPVRPVKASDVSTLGTRIIEAIQAAVGDNWRLNCGQCKSYLHSLNRTLAPDDAETIAGKIIGGIGLPGRIRDEVGGRENQQVWLRAIVDRVIAET